MAARFTALRSFWANPVVTRDLRVQLRGPRSYWQQAIFLLLLGLLSLIGYGMATSSYNGNGISVVQVQRQLQAFYYFIFMTLAVLICLIAPALTAASITGERQRLTLDLLVTTPLTPGELLVGKLLSSVAFLLLLLSLSLPASALCVILGGATLGDVFRVYLLIAIDGLVLAAIGLYFSCAVRGSLPALVWTYLCVFTFEVNIASMMGAAGVFGGGTSGGNPALAISALNPFVAVMVGPRSFDVFGVHVPVWVGTALLAFLFIRVLVTAASYRMGTYGNQVIGSLRRQLLFITALGMFFAAYSVLIASAGSSSSSGETLEVVLIVGFLLAAPLFPSLFAPAVAEDDGPGQIVEGGYKPLSAFRPDHAGALPFFHLWLVVLVLSGLAGAWASGNLAGNEAMLIALTVYYLTGLGFLFWSVARRAATLAPGVSGARALSFGLYLVLAVLPLMVMAFMNRDTDKNALALGWVFYPLMKTENGQAPGALLLSGTVSYVLGVLIFPFWSKVIPRYRNRKEASSVR